MLFLPSGDLTGPAFCSLKLNRDSTFGAFSNARTPVRKLVRSYLEDGTEVSIHAIQTSEVVAERASLYPIYSEMERCRIAVDAPSDPLLEREVVQFSGVSEQLLSKFVQRPLVLFRQVATPSREMARFMDLSDQAGRAPLIMNMPFDRFTPAVNPWKRRLAKLSISTRHQIRRVRIISFSDADNRLFTEMSCLDGTPFIQLHKELLAIALGSRAEQAVVDAGEFFGHQNSFERYQRFFALFTCFGVLAESYAFGSYEQRLLESAILPAIESTIRRFGRPPVILRLLPEGEETNSYWDEYPASVLPRALRAAGRDSAAAKLGRSC